MLESPNRAPFGLPAIDRLLEVFPSQPRRQPLNNTQRSTLHHLNQQQGFVSRNKPPVIEITGASPCSGKTQLLYKIIALSILPSTHSGYRIHGKDAAVVVLDVDNRFSVLRFQQILSSHLHSLKIPLQEEEIFSLSQTSCQHLHIFRPPSLGSLLTTVDSLSTYFNDTLNHFSANRTVDLLALNGLSASLWQDRLEADAVGLTGGTKERGNDGAHIQKYQDLVTALRRVQQTFECTIIATNLALAPIQYTAGHPALRPHLPAIWTNFCTLRIVTERNTVSKFGPGMSAEEAMKEGLQRQEAVGESGSSCWVNWWGSDGWRDAVRHELNSIPRGGGFWFRIDDGVVLIDGGQETPG